MSDTQSINAADAWPDLVGYFCGQWVANCDMRLSVHDVGFRQGVTAVERLRTYNGEWFVPERHFDRWERTIGALSIAPLPQRSELHRLLKDIVDRNRPFVDSQHDVGLTLFATPGVHTGQPTIGIHLNVIDHAVVSKRIADGQPIIVTSVVQPPSESWSRDIKVRSRIHYYLADRIASAGDDPSDAIGVLVDADGQVTETSTSNLAIVTDGVIVSPPKDRVLTGVTQSVVEEIAANEKLTWKRRPIFADDLRRADEVLLMGTTGGVWFANQVNATGPRNQAGAVFKKLRSAFDRLTGLNRI